MRCSTPITLISLLLALACSGQPLPPLERASAPQTLTTWQPHDHEVRSDARLRTLQRRGAADAPKVAPGFVAPYSLARVTSTFGDCRPGGRQHRAIDISGVGPNKGLGTPIRSMTRAKVLRIVLPGTDIPRYSRFDRRSGRVKRGGAWLPRAFDVPGYGRVHFFTRSHGSSRTGVMLVVEILGGPLDGHILRYMHMGAIHPTIREGDELEAGQEIALMGGTAIQDSSPHVHIDIETAEGQRVDFAPYLGLERDHRRCRRGRSR